MILTDKEQRIFLTAMRKERRLCAEVDRNFVHEPYEDTLTEICDSIIRKVKEAEPVKHGSWINEKSKIGYLSAEFSFECSVCGGGTGFSRYPTSAYCPNCGARMDGDAD